MTEQDPFDPATSYEDEAWDDDDERLLAQAAMLLHQRGEVQVAALLIDVQGVSTESSGYSDDPWTFNDGFVLEVDAFLVSRFTKDVLEHIRSALNAMADGTLRNFNQVRVREVKPRVSKAWREQLGAMLGGVGATNQARNPRTGPEHPIHDNLHFTNQWEHKVYVVRREKQDELPANETVAIFPLPGGRVPGHTVEPDLLVTYKGRAGVIEIDGPHHSGRRLQDSTREGLLLNAGVAYVARIDVKDTTQKAEVQQFVENFLVRLLDRR